MTFLKTIAGHNLSKPSTLSADAYAVNPSLGLVAISDGVTNSVFPDVWANLLVKTFCETTGSELDALFDLKNIDSWLDPIRKQWSADVKSIIDQNDFEPEITNKFLLKKPAAATFIGIQFIDQPAGARWRALIIGDSVAMQIRNKRIIGSYLISKSDEFSQKTYGLTSYPISNTQLQMVQGDTKKGDLFLLVTDALGKWLLQLSESSEQLFIMALDLMTGMQEPGQFEKFVVQQRLDRKRRLDLDDTSFILVDPKPDGEQMLEFAPASAKTGEQEAIPIPVSFSISENVSQSTLLPIGVDRPRAEQKLRHLDRRLVWGIVVGILLMGIGLALFISGDWGIHRWNSTATSTPVIPSNTPKKLQPSSITTETLIPSKTPVPTESSKPMIKETPTAPTGTNTAATPTVTPTSPPTRTLSPTPSITPTQTRKVDTTSSSNTDQQYLLITQHFV